MCRYSDFRKVWERTNLAPFAIKSDDPWYTYREYDELQKSTLLENPTLAWLDSAGDTSRYKTPFEIDRDRILNSQAFRRLEYKTQVFVNHEGDNYRTRLTHTLEVVLISKYIASALRLNVPLVEAIALGHDLGHAPFGHAGEDALNEIIKSQELKQPKGKKKDLEPYYYFCHNRQSLGVVEQLEKGYDWDKRCGERFEKSGLNLTRAVREGIVAHSNRGYDNKNLRGNYDEKKIKYPGSLEAQVVRLSDEIAQRAHDIEDGFRSGLLNTDDVKGFRSGLLNTDDVKKTIEEAVECMLDKCKVSNAGKTTAIKDENGKLFPIDLFFDKLQKFSNYINKDTTSHFDKDKIKKIIYDADYLRKLFSVIAKLLFIWRERSHLKKQRNKKNEEDFEEYGNRILKYVHVYLNILYGKPPLFYFSSFLKGLFISNAIEYSYHTIQSLLDADYRHFKGQQSPETKDEYRYLIFVDPKKGMQIAKIASNFDNRNTSNPYIRGPNDKSGEFLLEIEQKTVSWLEALQAKPDNADIYAEFIGGKDWKKDCKIRWLNKDLEVEKCTGVEISCKSSEEIGKFTIGVDQIQIYFIQIDKGDVSNLSRNDIFDFIEDRLIVSFDPEMKEIDTNVSKVIEANIHRHSKVERMNVKGKMMIRRLFEMYWKHPRIMHKRVWERLRVYSGFRERCNKEDEFKEYNYGIPNDEQLEMLYSENPADSPYQLLLFRRIVDHISGMTDRFIYDEYDRLFSTIKEIESREELELSGNRSV